MKYITTSFTKKHDMDHVPLSQILKPSISILILQSYYGRWLEYFKY